MNSHIAPFVFLARLLHDHGITEGCELHCEGSPIDSICRHYHLRTPSKIATVQTKSPEFVVASPDSDPSDSDI